MTSTVVDETDEEWAPGQPPPGGAQGGDKASRFIWTNLSETCLYAARRVAEILEEVARSGTNDFR